MDRQFKDDDREKRVLRSEGRAIGTGRDVDDDRAPVDRSADERLTAEIGTVLGRDTDDGTKAFHWAPINPNDDGIHLHSRQKSPGASQSAPVTDLTLRVPRGRSDGNIAARVTGGRAITGR
jgi:hypothetical protein